MRPGTANLRFHLALAAALAIARAQGQTPEVARDTTVVTLPAPPPGTSQQPVWGIDTGAAPARNGLLWKASSRTNIVYLLGSIHMGSAEMYPLPQPIEEAFRRSTVLIVEVDLNRIDQKKLLALVEAKGRYPQDDSLWNHIGEDTKAEVTRFCQRNGLNPEMFAQLKPWLATLTASLLPARGTETELAMGIDRYFLSRAANRVRVEELESAEYQLHVLADMPDDQQERYLRATLQGSGESRQKLKDLQAMWLEGDAAKLGAFMSSSLGDYPEFEKRVFGDRNPRMAAAAEQCLKSRERCFVVLGAGHMVGENGVVRLLEERGFQVKQILSRQ